MGDRHGDVAGAGALGAGGGADFEEELRALPGRLLPLDDDAAGFEPRAGAGDCAVERGL